MTQPILFRPALKTAVLLALLAAGCSPQTRISRMIARANLDDKAGRYDAAEIEYLNVLKSDRLNPTAIAQLGIIYFDAGSLRQAVPFLIEGRKLQPGNAELRIRLGQVFLASGGRSEARAEALFVLAQNSRDEEAPLLLARAAELPKERDEARKALQHLPPPASPSAMVALGILADREGRAREAEALFQRALAIDPRSANANLVLGAFYAARREFAPAGEAYARAVRILPVSPSSRLQFAEFKIETGDRASGRQMLDDIVRDTPDFLPAWLLLAQMAAEDQRYDVSAGLIGKILARDPTYLDALLLTGRLQLAEGKPDQAVAGLERTESLYPHSPVVEFQLAEAYRAAGLFDKSAASLDRALTWDPDFPEAILLAAQIQVERGDFGPAIVAMKKLLQRQPDSARAQLILGSAYLRANDPAGALDVYRKMAAAMPSLPQPVFLQGLVMLRFGQNAEARQLFERALELDPHYLPALEQAVSLDIREKRYDLARQRLESRQAQDPARAEYPLLLGRVFAAEHAWTQAEASIEKGIRLQPDFPGAALLLAEVYTDAGEDRKALGSLQGVVAGNPKDLDALMLLAAAESRLGDDPAARAAYERILAADPGYVPALNNLAWLMMEKFGQLDQAFALADQARKLRPDEPHVADTLGWILYRQRHFRWASGLLQEASDKFPLDPEINYHLGMTHYMLGEEIPARLALAAAVDAGGDFPERRDAQRRLSLLAIDADSPGPANRATLEKAAADLPDDPVVLLRLSFLREQQGEAGQAFRAGEQAWRQNPENAAVVARWSQLQAARGDLAAAFALAKTAHELAPDDRRITRALGRLALQSGQAPWAVSLLQTCAAAEPNDPGVAFDLAEAWYGAGRVDDAEQSMRQTLAMKPSSAQAERIGRFLDLVELAKHPARAAAAGVRVEAALAADPRSVPGLMAMGAISEFRGDPRAAEQDYERALLASPDFLPARRSLALLCAEAPGDDPEVLRLAAKAWEDYPQDPAVARACGIIAYRLGNYAEAESLLADGAGAGRGDGEAMFYLGMSRHRLQERSGRDMLQRALRLPLRADLAAEARQTLAELK